LHSRCGNPSNSQKRRFEATNRKSLSTTLIALIHVFEDLVEQRLALAQGFFVVVRRFGHLRRLLLRVAGFVHRHLPRVVGVR